MDKTFADFFTFSHNFSSPQVKRNQILSAESDSTNCISLLFFIIKLVYLAFSFLFLLRFQVSAKEYLRIRNMNWSFPTASGTVFHKKILQMPGLDDWYQANHPKAKFRHFLKSYKTLAVKHSTEKFIQLNFVNLSKTFCSRMSGEIHFYFEPRPNPSILHFRKILVFQTIQSFFKLIFRVTQSK